MQEVLSIAQINEYIRTKLDSDVLLAQVAVRGEISNYKMYPSGHHYFTLKDDISSLKCVMFKGNAVRLRVRPENGMQIIAVGRITVYPRDGVYQLYCTSMMVDGIGDLHVAFEQLKKQLAAEGLFDPSHKKPIPRYPGIIGIITSSAGAAVHDMNRIIRKRYPIAQIRLLPVRVQGAEAPGEIASAIRYANHFDLADVLIVGRGGGSIEDLWAFNDAQVAHAIYDSQIPVISAVGHEPDVTIADYVADLRAATPSNAAELVVPDQETLYQYLDSASSTITAAYAKQLKYARQRLDTLASAKVLHVPTGYTEQKRRELNLLLSQLSSDYNRIVSANRRRFVEEVSKLDAMSPLKVLARGYAAVYTADREVLRSVNQVQLGERISIIVSDGAITAVVQEKEENHE